MLQKHAGLAPCRSGQLFFGALVHVNQTKLNTELSKKMLFKLLEFRLLLYRRVSDVTKIAFASADQVTQNIGNLADDSAIGVVDTD